MWVPSEFGVLVAGGEVVIARELDLTGRLGIVREFDAHTVVCSSVPCGLSVRKCGGGPGCGDTALDRSR